ncbi:hypothetical protein [Pontiella sulfatireligans]|uniref:Uncharacterized protein n=1 Tax=Pontiella sulfatireligans TaxID=2750658 RepID=A0A6C2UIB2_9BACT|nr:hypothetical protein [Pontiella sulfatireligans]VGO19161.1 hypothetical protein SCARR_01218 [Pontiella sulfatireligans]
MFRKEQLRRIVLMVGGLLFLAVGLNALRIGKWLEKRADTPSLDAAHKEYTHNVAEGLAVRNGAYPEIDLLRFESCKIQKQTKGGFSFGAFNVLVIDGLEVAAPPQTSRSSNGKSGGSRGNDGLVSSLVEKELRSLLAQYPRFSAVRINGLSVGVIDPDTGGGALRNVLTAKKATAGGKRQLDLTGCSFLTDAGERIECKSASLALEWPLRISTERGSFQVAGFSNGFAGAVAGLNRKRTEMFK